MSNYKEVQKKLKGPDEFQVQVISWFNQLLRHKSQLAMAAGMIVLVTLGAWGVRYFNKKQTSQRQDILAEADLTYQSELDKSQKERDALQRELDKLATPAEPDKAKAEAAKKELQDRIKALKPDHRGSMAQYHQVYNQLSKYPEGWLAGTRYASSLIKDKKLEEGKKILAEILAASKGHLFFQLHGGIIYLGLLEDLKDYDAALNQAEELLKTAPTDLKAKILMTKSRIQAAKSQVTEAKQTLDRVIKDYSSSPEAERAWGMRAMIN